MRKIPLSMLAAAVALSAAVLVPASARAMTAGTAPAIQEAATELSDVSEVRRICRHRRWSSRVRCWYRPTVCYHRAWSSRRVCRY